MSRIRTTHTVAELQLSAAAYDEIAQLLREAGYEHAFNDGVIDMTGIGLTRKMKVNSVRRTCDGYPTQWDGELDDGRTIYVRYRWGILAVRVSEEAHPVDQYAAVHGREIIALKLGEEMGGTLEFSELRQHTAHAIEWPDNEEQ
jgi:hypothetical protein